VAGRRRYPRIARKLFVKTEFLIKNGRERSYMSSGAGNTSDPQSWVERYGDLLFRYAIARVQDRSRAEDLVQETFAAALANRERFGGTSSEQTWLVGILKNKIVDYYRQAALDRGFETLDSRPDATDALFDRQQSWKASHAQWTLDPESTYNQREFWEVFTRCLSALPPGMADAFSLRELVGLRAKEVCQVLGISPTNLWTRLYRARLRLRQCLESQWFDQNRRPRR